MEECAVDSAGLVRGFAVYVAETTPSSNSSKASLEGCWTSDKTNSLILHSTHPGPPHHVFAWHNGQYDKAVLSRPFASPRHGDSQS